MTMFQRKSILDLRFPSHWTILWELMNWQTQVIENKEHFVIGGLDFDTCTKVFDSTVIPIMTYSSGLWGHKLYDLLERLQYRAITTFLGVGKTSLIPSYFFAIFVGFRYI